MRPAIYTVNYIIINADTGWGRGMPGVGVWQDGQEVVIDLRQTQPPPRSRHDRLTQRKLHPLS